MESIDFEILIGSIKDVYLNDEDLDIWLTQNGVKSCDVGDVISILIDFGCLIPMLDEMTLMYFYLGRRKPKLVIN